MAETIKWVWMVENVGLAGSWDSYDDAVESLRKESDPVLVQWPDGKTEEFPKTKVDVVAEEEYD